MNREDGMAPYGKLSDPISVASPPSLSRSPRRSEPFCVEGKFHQLAEWPRS